MQTKEGREEEGSVLVALAVVVDTPITLVLSLSDTLGELDDSILPCVRERMRDNHHAPDGID